MTENNDNLIIFRLLKWDIQLDSMVYLTWVKHETEIIGGLVIHTNPFKGNGCFTHFWIEAARRYLSENPDLCIWDFNGDFEKPTVHPSILCPCSFHGFIKNGKWVKA